MAKKKGNKDKGKGKDKDKGKGNKKKLSGVVLEVAQKVKEEKTTKNPTKVAKRKKEEILNDLKTYEEGIHFEINKDGKVKFKSISENIPKALKLLNDLLAQPEEREVNQNILKTGLKVFDLSLEAFFNPNLVEKTIPSHAILDDLLKNFFETVIVENFEKENQSNKKSKTLPRIRLGDENYYQFYKSIFRHYESQNNKLTDEVLIDVVKYFIEKGDIEGVDSFLNYYQREIEPEQNRKSLEDFLGKIAAKQESRTLLIFTMDALNQHKSIDLFKLIYENCKKHLNEKDKYGRNLLFSALMQLQASSKEIKSPILDIAVEMLIGGAEILQSENISGMNLGDEGISQLLNGFPQFIKHNIDEYKTTSLKDFRNKLEITISDKSEIQIIPRKPMPQEENVKVEEIKKKLEEAEKEAAKLKEEAAKLKEEAAKLKEETGKEIETLKKSNLDLSTEMDGLKQEIKEAKKEKDVAIKEKQDEQSQESEELIKLREENQSLAQQLHDAQNKVNILSDYGQMIFSENCNLKQEFSKILEELQSTKYERDVLATLMITRNQKPSTNPQPLYPATQGTPFPPPPTSDSGRGRY